MGGNQTQNDDAEDKERLIIRGFLKVSAQL